LASASYLIHLSQSVRHAVYQVPVEQTGISVCRVLGFFFELIY